jgi:nucleotide-binding universal stress UspA family protein
MKFIEKILFPVDLTEANEDLIPYVLTMVDKFNAQLNVLYVMRPFQHFSDIFMAEYAISDFNAFEARVAADCRKKMDELINVQFGRLDRVQGEVLPGDPVDTILQFITDRKIDLVVMGTHGRKGVGRVLFGSVAQRVVKWAHVPVLVVNPSAPQA